MIYPDDFDSLLPIDRKSFLLLPSTTQVALCIHMLEAQVNDGGFHQFFGNTSGEIVPETILALEKIGAAKTRNLLERALVIGYPSGYPLDSTHHDKLLAYFDDVADALEPIDAEFYAYAEPLSDLVNTFLARQA